MKTTLLMLGLMNLVGCAPHVASVTAINPGADMPVFWAHIQTDDANKDGVYRCYDADGKPVCKRAKIIAPCTREKCGE